MTKKITCLLLVLVVAVTFCLAGCSQQTTDTASDASAANAAPTDTLSLSIAATPFSGMVLHYIADYCGFYEEEGIDVELQYINGFTDATEAVSSGAVDIATTYGTSGPLNEISNGRDVTIFAGYMLTGCMPIMAREDEEYTGIESLIGKTVTSRGGGGGGNEPIYQALLEAGYDPVNDVNWMHGVDQSVALEMVAKGEADYAVGTTGIQTTAKEMGLKTVAFLSDLVPEYSCCRIWCQTEWFNENQEACLRALKAWLRAQEVLEKDPDLAVKLTVENSDLSQEYVEGFELDSHWWVCLDPHWKGVSNNAEVLAQCDVINEIDTNYLAECFNCELYKQALDECEEKYGSEDPDFYEKYQELYESANAEYVENYMK